MFVTDLVSCLFLLKVTLPFLLAGFVVDVNKKKGDHENCVGSVYNVPSLVSNRPQPWRWKKATTRCVYHQRETSEN